MPAKSSTISEIMEWLSSLAGQNLQVQACDGMLVAVDPERGTPVGAISLEAHDTQDRVVIRLKGDSEAVAAGIALLSNELTAGQLREFLFERLESHKIGVAAATHDEDTPDITLRLIRDSA